MHGLRLPLIAATLLLAIPVWPQQQPIEFPHNTHIDKGLDCVDCHITVDTKAEAGLPSVRQCMLCHWSVATDGPGVQRLREYADRRHEVPWVRVYKFEASAHARFRHAAHVRAGVECARCHGDVAKMTVATRQVEHNMGTCVSCHRESGASDDCAACHY